MDLLDTDTAAKILQSVANTCGQGTAIRWMELNRDWRQWGRAWLSTVKSVQLVLPMDASDLHEMNDPEQVAEQQRERVAALVRQCPGCTSVRLRVKESLFYDTTALAGSNEFSAESAFGFPSSEVDERPARLDIKRPLDINAGLCALSELMGPRLLKLDLSNNCGLGPPAEMGCIKSAGNVMDEGMASVAAHCPNIVALDLSQCAPCYNLRDTEGESFMGVHPATLLRLVEGCGRSLKSLNIAGVLRYSRRLRIFPPSHIALRNPLPAILSETIQHCPALEYLNIKGNDDLIDMMAPRPFNNKDDLPPYVSALISTCADLECLDVRYVSTYLWGAECLMAVVEGCRNLKKIRWSSGSGISKGTRLAVAQRHPHMHLEGGRDYSSDESSMDFDLFD